MLRTIARYARYVKPFFEKNFLVRAHYARTRAHACTRTRTHARAPMHTRVHACTHAHAHTRARTRTHAYARTHTRMGAGGKSAARAVGESHTSIFCSFSILVGLTDFLLFAIVANIRLKI